MKSFRGFVSDDSDAHDPSARVIDHGRYRCLVIGRDPSPHDKAKLLTAATRELDRRAADFARDEAERLYDG